MTTRLQSALTQILRQPVTMRVKRVVRDIQWRLRGDVAANPPLPERIDTVLFICLGNICRSPFAGLLAQRLMTEHHKVRTVARSAGIRTTQSGRSPREARDAAAVYGISLEDHRPRTLTEELMASHDLIVVMEHQQLLTLWRSYPDAASRVVLLPLFDHDAAGYERFNIEDPFMQPPLEYAHCYRRIVRATTALCETIAMRGTALEEAGRC